MAIYNLFISHSWAYEEQYDRLIELLDGASRFNYKDNSVPKDDPIHTLGNGDQELYDALQRKIKSSHVVVILAGKYATYSKWINNEIEIAQSDSQNTVPILALKPRGAAQMSVPVQEAANKIVGWNTDSIVGGIRNLVNAKIIATQKKQALADSIRNLFKLP